LFHFGYHILRDIYILEPLGEQIDVIVEPIWRCSLVKFFD
jgi:hypothetical protein